MPKGHAWAVKKKTLKKKAKRFVCPIVFEGLIGEKYHELVWYERVFSNLLF